MNVTAQKYNICHPAHRLAPEPDLIGRLANGSLAPLAR